MIQFKILSGKKAGTAWKARRFPVRIGRSPGADLVLEEEGVFEEHAVVQFAAGAGFTWQTRPDALASINGEPAREAVLHNGDIIDVGSARVQFWLAETRQTGLGRREAFTWLLAGAVVAGQVVLLYWLLRF